MSLIISFGKIKKPQTFVLENGLKVMIVENHKLPRVTFNLTLDNAPFAEGNKKGVDENGRSISKQAGQMQPLQRNFGIYFRRGEVLQHLRVFGS